MDESDLSGSGIGGMTETVCLDHFSDPMLRDQLRPEMKETACSYCSRTPLQGYGPFAVPMDEVGRVVWEAMTWLYAETWDAPLYFEGTPLSWDDEPSLYEANDVIHDTAENAIDPAFAQPIIVAMKAAMTSSDHWVGRGGWRRSSPTIGLRSRPL